MRNCLKSQAMDEIAIWGKEEEKRRKECLDFREIGLDCNHEPFSCIRNSTIQDGRSTLSII